MKYDARSARCSVFVYHEGLLASVGHDLTFAVRELSIDVDWEARVVHARFDARSLHVVAPVLGARDQRTIEKHVMQDVLETGTYPFIEFTSSSAVPIEKGYAVEGRLALHGQGRTLSFTVATDTARATARVRVQQPDFGIRPFSAMLGTLRIKPEVDIEVDVPLIPASSEGEASRERAAVRGR